MNQNKDLKAIAEEVIEEAKREIEEAHKPITDLHDSLLFLEEIDVCYANPYSDCLEINFGKDIPKFAITVNSEHNYYVERLGYGCNVTKTECNSLEQLVRLIANFSVTKDFETAAKVAGCEYVERNAD